MRPVFRSLPSLTAWKQSNIKALFKLPPKSKGLLTLRPTGGNAGYVGYSHRGMSCGWTICLAPGRSAVARRGVLTQWTLSCTPPPPGPDTHANTTGYGVIAQAFELIAPLTDPHADQITREGRVT